MVEYDFQEQLALWKRGEDAVYRHLRSKKNIVEVKDLSEMKGRQSMGIDAMMIYESEDGILYSSFFDVKTDYQLHKTGNFFIETNSSEEKQWCMLTTKAEQFLYYDPILWKLYHLPIFPLRKWYKEKGIGKKHLSVTNKNYTGEWILISLDELQEIIPTVEIENIEPLQNDLIS